jgi:uncharacterized OB-fold protein
MYPQTYCPFCHGVTGTGGFVHEWNCPNNPVNHTAGGDTTPLGWRCPSCGQVYSPFVGECHNCRPRMVTGNTSGVFNAD